MTESHYNPRREYIRHTADVPIQVRTVPGSIPLTQLGRNISHGGLAFASDACLETGSVIELRIPEVDPPFEAHARVAWCEEEAEGFSVGVQFLDATDAFRARMVEQVCTIEKYRQDVREQEGRELDSQEAAAEWIQKFAGRFPDSSAA